MSASRVEPTLSRRSFCRATLVAGAGLAFAARVSQANAFPPGSQQRAKFAEVLAGTEIAYRLARKHKLKTAWGTDVLFSAALARRQGELLVKLARWYKPAEILVMATGTNAELLAMSGKRNPYPGKLGVVEEGALADLLLVDGNPIENIELIADPAATVRVRARCPAGSTTARFPAAALLGVWALARDPAVIELPNGSTTLRIARSGPTPKQTWTVSVRPAGGG